MYRLNNRLGSALVGLTFVFLSGAARAAGPGAAPGGHHVRLNAPMHVHLHHAHVRAQSGSAANSIQSNSGTLTVTATVDTAATLGMTVPQSGNSSPRRINLNLASTTRSLTPGKLVQSSPVLITEGGVARLVTAQTRVTPAERLALYQVVSTGRQTIELGVRGNAVGGSFVVGSNFSTYVRSLDIPIGVTAIKDFGTGSTLNLAGNFINGGTFYALSANGQVTTATVNARNIVNQQGGLLTTVVPAAAQSGFNSVVPNLSLSLNALQDVVNLGTMSSSGNLTVAAGGSIINALPAGVSGARPVMQAMNNVNLQSGALANAGLIAATTGNINVNANPARDIVINNNGGQLQALNGAINVRDASYTGSANLSLAGGDLLSVETNLNTGEGVLNLNVANVSGTLNTDAQVAHVVTSTPTLVLGNSDIHGDPTFSNSSGGITFTGTVNVARGPLVFVASGDIIATGAVVFNIGRCPRCQGGFPIIFIAGANITSPPPGAPRTLTIPPLPAAGSVTLNGSSMTGGVIDFTGASVTVNSSARAPVFGTGLSAFATLQPAPGGNITFAAFGNGAGSGGVINLPTTTINPLGSPATRGVPAGAPGTVTYIAPNGITPGRIVGGGAAVTNNLQPATSNGGPLTFGAGGRITSGNTLIGVPLPSPSPVPIPRVVPTPILSLVENEPEPIPILFVPPPQAFTPPIVVPTDVTYVNVEEVGPEAGLALAGVHQTNFPATGKLKGKEGGILVKYHPGSSYDRPDVYSVDLKSGAVLVSVRRPSEQAMVHTGLGDVALAANAAATVSSENGVLRVQNITGRGESVKVQFARGSGEGVPGTKTVAIKPGFEFVVSDHRLGRSDIRPVDGVARRHSKVMENGYAAVSEFSVESLLSSSELIASMSQKTAGAGERQILGDMSKMAAVLNYVNGTQGFVAEASVGPMDQ